MPTGPWQATRQGGSLQTLRTPSLGPLPAAAMTKVSGFIVSCSDGPSPEDPPPSAREANTTEAGGRGGERNKLIPQGRDGGGWGACIHSPPPPGKFKFG